MWISDIQLLEGLTDRADVVVCTGLVALIDDCIKSRFSLKGRRAKTPWTQTTEPSEPGFVGFDRSFGLFKSTVDFSKRRESSEQQAGLSSSGSGMRESPSP
jgi:hypothetical protein